MMEDVMKVVGIMISNMGKDSFVIKQDLFVLEFGKTGRD
jgi:hypothetical protein